MKRILVAMSGGVDSSVAAGLLKEQGWDVTGATLLLWDTLDPAPDAREVCRTLGIPHETFDLRKEFKERIVDYFCAEYLDARTPNPCIRCNRGIKFGLLKELGEQMDIRYLATGHYARVEEDPRFKGKVLKKGFDETKDQSYALFALERSVLDRIVLPMGSLKKNRTREMASEAGLHVEHKSESQDICFIPDGDYARFIMDRYPVACQPGPIVNRQGEVLGRHKGLIHYTVGQRRGMGVAAARPYYVLELRPRDNTLLIGFEDEVFQDTFSVRDVNWLVEPPEKSTEAHVKIRYSSKEYPAKVFPEATSGRALIRFQAPQKAVTPGQAAVFYDNDVVLGGGWIVSPRGKVESELQGDR